MNEPRSPWHSTWEAAIEAACAGYSEPEVRARRGNARRFAQWCAERGLDPTATERQEVDAYLDDLPGTDWQRRLKAASRLRHVMRDIDPRHAARSAGLGSQVHLLRATAGTPLGRLKDHVVRQFDSPVRQAVRESAIGRLLAWCADVGLDPLAIGASDLPQFRAWLRSIGIKSRELGVVAKDFVEARHSPEGRAILGEPEPTPRPLRLETVVPLRPRFELHDIAPADPLSDLPPMVTLSPLGGRSAQAQG
jgi:hypothetical protein